jgi:hypothetical protein
MPNIAIPSYSKLFKKATTPQLIDQSKAVGTAFLRQGRENPKFFTTGKNTPVENIEEMMQRYGVRAAPRGETGIDFFDVDSGRRYSIDTKFGSEVLDEYETMGWPGLENVLEYVDPSGKYFSIDSTTSEAGSGIGKKIYPAIWDAMFGSGEGYTRFTNSLTGANLVRGPLNELGAFVKHGENARLLPNTQQYRYTNIQPRNIMMYGPEEQIGSRLLDFAARSQVHMPDDFKMISPKIARPSDFEDLAARIRSLDPKDLGHSYNSVVGPRHLKARGALELLLEGKPVPEFYWDGMGGLRRGGLVKDRQRGA